MRVLNIRIFAFVLIGFIPCIPAYSDELKFPMYGDFDNFPPNHIAPIQMQEPTEPAKQLVKTNSKVYVIKSSDYWKKWEKESDSKIKQSYKKKFKKKLSSFEKVTKPCKFIITLTDGGLASSRLNESSGNRLYDGIILFAVKFCNFSKDYPERSKYKRVEIFGLVSPNNSYKIQKLLGYMTHEYEWRDVKSKKTK